MVIPSNSFVFLIFLGSGDQENEAVFPELLQRVEGVGGSEACLGCSVWTETHCGWWPGVTSCRVSGESVTVRRGLASSPVSAGNLPNGLEQGPAPFLSLSCLIY